VGLELIDSSNGSFEIVNLEPEQYPITIWLVVLIPNGTVVMVDIKPMQLKDQIVSHLQPFVFVPAVIALAAEQSLIPATAGFDVSYGN
jgi:hypothetical protein